MPLIFRTVFGFVLRFLLGRSLPTGTKLRRQVAALPIKWDAGGGLLVLLITSRKQGRFIVPRGWPMRGKADHRAAAIEAKEEAGVTGRVQTAPIGSYTYRKRVGRRSELILVDVFVLEVREELSEWREKGQRQRLWLSVEAAVEMVDEPGLVPIVRALPDAL